MQVSHLLGGCCLDLSSCTAAAAQRPTQAEHTDVQAYRMPQIMCDWKQCPETSRPSECTTRANHGATQHAFSCVLSEQTVLLQAPKKSCTRMDRCSHARKRPCEASTGLATISGAKGSALTVGHLTARSQAPQSPRQLGCRRAAGSLYPRGACGTAASGPAVAGSGGNPTTSGSCNGPAELLALAAGGKASALEERRGRRRSGHGAGSASAAAVAAAGGARGSTGGRGMKG